MSELTKLLEGVKVEWKEVGDVLIRTKGTKITAEQMKAMHKEGAPLKIFAGGKTTAFFDFKDIPEKDINTNPSIIVKSRGVIEFEYYDLPFSHKNEMWSYYSGNQFINLRFIYYLLKKEELYFQNIGKKMQMPQISIPITDKFKIPIPCPDDPEKSLKIQQQIVRILDNLSEETNQLTAALQIELNLHLKRYDFYREELFKFGGKEVEWKCLGDIAKKISSGGTPKTNIKTYYGGDIPWLRTQEVGYGDIWDTEIKITEQGLKDSSAKLIPVNCLILAMYGATVGRVSINKIPLSTNQACANIELDPDVLDYRYAFHYLRSNYKYIKSLGTGPQTNINAGIVKNLRIPIPLINNPKKSLQEQERIVKILDDLDAETKAITKTIQKEIALRNKQYEYYRDRLLSFQSLQTEVEAIQ